MHRTCICITSGLIDHDLNILIVRFFIDGLTNCVRNQQSFHDILKLVVVLYHHDNLLRMLSQWRRVRRCDNVAVDTVSTIDVRTPAPSTSLVSSQFALKTSF